MALTQTKPAPVVAVSSAFVAEIVGTFMLTFSGTATVLATHQLHPSGLFSVVDDIAVSLAFALGVVAAIYTVARVSGAHINPAITIGLAALGKFPWRLVPVYVVAQFIGAVLAGLMNWLMFGDAARALLMGGTKPGPGVSWWQALIVELVLTLILMVVVMATAVYERAPGGGMPAGLAIGFWIGAAIFLALGVSGGSLNPARTIGPDIIAGSFPYWWVYVVGPIVGAVIGAALWEGVLKHGHKELVESIGETDADLAA